MKSKKIGKGEKFSKQDHKQKIDFYCDSNREIRKREWKSLQKFFAVNALEFVSE